MHRPSDGEATTLPPAPRQRVPTAALGRQYGSLGSSLRTAPLKLSAVVVYAAVFLVCDPLWTDLLKIQ